jgi:hypothetical protein
MHGLKIKWHHYSPLIQDTFIDVMNVTINGEEKGLIRSLIRVAARIVIKYYSIISMKAL